MDRLDRLDRHRTPPLYRFFSLALSRRLAVAGLAVVALSAPLAGCRARDGEGRGARQAAADAEWAWLQKTKADLDARRQRLAEPPNAANAPETARLKAEVARETGEFDRRLIGFLNAAPPVEGEPLTPRQKGALRMKSDEDILLAQEYIEQGGDFQRAIEIYQAALAFDPGYERLKSELEAARARRYVSRDVFDQVKEGMTDAEVRSLLGQPNLHSVREYPEHGVIGWFYPKDESGAAAGVWFEKREGALKVYKLDFDAIVPRGAPPGAAPAG
jgi:tetratricopeptide (TPR) repeat protein